MSATTRDLIRPNPSKKVQYILAIFVCILLFFTARAFFGQTGTLDTDLNPAIGAGSEAVEMNSVREGGLVAFKTP